MCLHVSVYVCVHTGTYTIVSSHARCPFWDRHTGQPHDAEQPLVIFSQGDESYFKTSEEGRELEKPSSFQCPHSSAVSMLNSLLEKCGWENRSLLPLRGSQERNVADRRKACSVDRQDGFARQALLPSLTTWIPSPHDGKSKPTLGSYPLTSTQSQFPRNSASSLKEKIS